MSGFGNTNREDRAPAFQVEFDSTASPIISTVNSRSISQFNQYLLSLRYAEPEQPPRANNPPSKPYMNAFMARSSRHLPLYRIRGPNAMI